MIEQKRLLHLVVVRLTLQERELVEVQTSNNLSQLLLRLHLVRKDKQEANPGYHLRESDTQVRIKLSPPQPRTK